MSTAKDSIKMKRDVKITPHLQQYAPVWIIDEQFIEEDDAVQFSAIFHHHSYGWVNRRYRYDAFNDVLYHKGQILIDDEDQLAEIQEQEPDITTTVADTPNAYGG